jgi:hypothetical protein
MSKLQKNDGVCLGSVPCNTAEPLGVQGQQGGKRNFASPYIVTPLFPISPDRLRFDKVENVILAAAFARELGKPLHYNLTANCPPDVDPDELFSELRKRLSEWLKNNEGVAAFVWAVETNGGPHTHILLHVSKDKKPKCQKYVRKWLKEMLGVAHLPVRTINFTRIDSEGDPDEHVKKRVRYILKRADDATRHFIGCETKTDVGPTIVGKAIGVSQDIGETSRKRAGGVQLSGCRGVSKPMREAAEASNAARELEDFSLPSTGLSALSTYFASCR